MKKNAVMSILLGVILLTSSLGTAPVTALDKTFNLEVEPDCGFNVLVWDEVPGATQYFIYRGNAPGEEFETPLLDFPLQETSFKDEINIKNGQEYCYFVTALDSSASEFARSNEACAIPSCYEEPDEDDCKLVLRYQQDNKTYMANGEQKDMDTPPVNVNSRLFLVVRYVAQEIPGTTIDWVDATKTVIITTRDGKRIELQIGNKDANIDGQIIQIDPNNPGVVPFITEGRAHTPMRFIAENLGATGPDDIRWYGDTKTVELRFDDPVCEKCDWVGGKVLSKKEKYYLSSTTPDSFFDVFVEICGGTKKRIYLTEDMQAENSKDKLGNYQGNARFCFHEDGDLVKWRALPNDEVCLEETPEPEEVCVCIKVEQKECSDDLITVFGKTCRGTNYLITLLIDNPDVCSEIVVGNCYEFCGAMTFTFADRKLLPADSFEQVDCPCPCEDCTWIAGEITSVVSYVTGSLRLYAVVYQTCEEGEMTFTSTANFEDMLGSGFTLSDYEGCANICVDEEGVITRWQALPELENCCEIPEPPEPEIECVCLEIVRGDCTNWNGIDSEGKMWNLRFRENPELCDGIEVGKFFEFCGEVTRITAPGLGATGIMMDVTGVEELDEPCETDCNWIKGKVVASIGKVGSYTSVLLDGCGIHDRTLTTYNNHYDMSRSTPLETFTGCASFCLEDDGKTIRMWRIEEDDCCPDSACVNLKIDRLNCDSDTPIIHGTNLENENDFWKISVDTPEICAELSEGDCISVCGFVTNKTEDRTELTANEIETIGCPPTTIIEECFCIQVVENNCTSDSPSVTARDVYGNTVTLNFDSDRVSFCERFTVDSYWEVCGEVTFGRRRMGVDKFVQVNTAVPLDSPCTSICNYIKINEVNCSPDDGEPTATGYDLGYTRWTLHFEEGSDLCDDLVVGNCYTVCGDKIIEEGPVMRIRGQEKMDVESITLTECIELPPYSCFCVEISEVNLEASSPFAIAFTGLSTVPIEVKINLGELAPEDYAELEEGTFWEVCGTMLFSRMDDRPEINASSFVRLDEPCEINIPGCVSITITSTRGEIRGIDYTSFRSWTIKMADGSPLLSTEIEVGQCWKFCGYRTPVDDDDDIGIIFGNELYIVSMEQIECPCTEPERECIGGVIERIECSAFSTNSIVMIRVDAGDRRLLLIRDTVEDFDCSELEVGMCIDVCGAYSIPGSPFFVLDYFEIIGCD